MTMENPPFQDVISYRNYSNCSSRKSISVPFLLIQKWLSPKRCNKMRLASAPWPFLQKSFFLGRSKPSLTRGFFMLKGFIPLRWWFFNRQASYMSNLGVPNQFFWGMPGADWLLCCHGEESWALWELSRPDATKQRSIPLFLSTRNHQNFKISKFQNIACWAAYFWAVATTPRAPYRVPRRKLMFERPVDLKEAAEREVCWGRAWFSRGF